VVRGLKPEDHNDSSSKALPERLWRLAYMGFKDNQPDALRSLNEVLGSELGMGMPYRPESEIRWSGLIPEVLKSLNKDQISGSTLEAANETRNGIVKITEAVSGTLGLGNSAIAWWCVIILLRVRNRSSHTP
jgi:hypothetical protein